MSLENVLQTFRDSIKNVNEFVSIAFEVDANNDYRRSNTEKDFIVSSAFLKMFIGWEEFLEYAFIEYLLGEHSIKGDEIVRYANPIDETHAQKMVVGTLNYVDWANHQNVTTLASIFFDSGEPFYTALNSISSDLVDLKVIRNASAHISTTTQTKLASLASRKLKKQISNISIADFVTRFSPEDNSKTILQYYEVLLEVTAENIANSNV